MFLCEFVFVQRSKMSNTVCLLYDKNDVSIYPYALVTVLLNMIHVLKNIFVCLISRKP